MTAFSGKARLCLDAQPGRTDDPDRIGALGPLPSRHGIIEKIQASHWLVDVLDDLIGMARASGLAETVRGLERSREAAQREWARPR
ncbi:MAG: hypothetical protein RLZZ528_693 [Pseudomonadota bacterium]|jgi:hypothetical protein